MKNKNKKNQHQRMRLKKLKEKKTKLPKKDPSERRVWVVQCACAFIKKSRHACLPAQIHTPRPSLLFLIYYPNVKKKKKTKQNSRQ